MGGEGVGWRGVLQSETRSLMAAAASASRQRREVCDTRQGEGLLTALLAMVPETLATAFDPSATFESLFAKPESSRPRDHGIGMCGSDPDRSLAAERPSVKRLGANSQKRRCLGASDLCALTGANSVFSPLPENHRQAARPDSHAPHNRTGHQRRPRLTPASMDGCAHALAHFPRVRQWGAGRRSWCRLRADGAIH